MRYSASRDRQTGLRGRQTECALLADLVGAIRRGEGRSLVLRGEPGIGKTALLEHLVDSASEMTILRATGVESEMELAFAGLHQLFLPLQDRFDLVPAPQLEALETVFGLRSGTGPDRLLVGLAVDYAIQFQSRVHEQLEREPHDRALAVRSAAARSAPAIATAAAAAAAAMLVLLTSPVPMVRGFGVLLVGGVLLGVLCAFTAGAAALALPGGGWRRGIRSSPRPPRAARAPGGAGLGAAWRGARELLWKNPLTRVLSGAALERAVRRPALVLGIGLALAALGWGLDTQTRVETDQGKLVAVVTQTQMVL